MRLMKLNAQLEGKLEVLSVEAEAAIKERAKYSSELGVLRSQLQVRPVPNPSPKPQSS
mgnify:CR=1 FL=1